MVADSRVAASLVPSLGVKKNVYASRDFLPSAIIVHTTGSGPLRRFKSKKEKNKFGYSSPFDAALRIYTQVMKSGPHYLIGQQGKCVQVCPESFCAWHVGSSKSRPYFSNPSGWSKNKNNVRWWFDRWDSIESPKELAGGQLWKKHQGKNPISLSIRSMYGSCNANTIGIEVVPPLEAPRGYWSPECWETLVKLIEDVASRNGIPVEKERILTHSDAHPLARSSLGKPWDPSETQFTWEFFCAQLESYALG